MQRLVPLGAKLRKSDQSLVVGNIFYIARFTQHKTYGRTLVRKQERGPWVEEFAMSRGHTHFYYDMHCIETMMIPHVPKNNT